MSNSGAEEISQKNGYLYLKLFEDGTEAVVAPLFSTAAILHVLNDWGYENRWCYKTVQAAKDALDAWDGTGEPEGWHRHPTTGRRREDGKEYINF